ncbi:restriction endonuclease subunit S [Flammeovirga sp. OC4]|uniref:restriction endonuclease subunit S n=1 Tax=Flammeovirga sp. OC4 TaxID=1382345 RepID=UPI0005C60A0D|nr:restriction endonuclease subunit S [Flammeovirga sp. OC4]
MNNWQIFRLGEISDSCLGKMLDKKKNKGEYQPYLSNKCVRWGGFDFDFLSEMKFEVHEEERYGLEYGDLIICEGGEPGRCAIWRNNMPNMKIQKALHRLRVKKGFSYEFLYYRMLLAGRTNGLDRYFIGSTIKHLTGVNLKNIEFSFPSFNTQKAIAKVLSNLDLKIEINNKINNQLESMAKLLYDYWFVQFDFPNENGKPYRSSGGQMVYNEELKREIPEGWEVKKINEIAYNVSNSIKPEEEEYLPYLPIDKLPRKQLYYSEYENREEAKSSLIKFNEDDILLGAMRVYFHRVCNAIEDGISRSTLMVIRSLDENLKNYILFTLNKEDSIEFATQNSTGSSIPYAKWINGLENLLIPTPLDNKVFHQFNNHIDPILEKFKITAKEDRQLHKLRDWLLPMLMNGQVSVEDIEL